LSIARAETLESIAAETDSPVIRAPPCLCIAIGRPNSVGKRTAGRPAGNPFDAGSLTRQPRKNGRKAMYIGIGGLILLIILLMILL
jgi:hypothetical protein